MLDSGAYSAWTRGARIDIREYIQFIQRNEALLACYVNLDVIAGDGGNRAWRQADIEKAAAQSYANQQRMKDAGLRPIPVFHQDEVVHWLERYLSDGECYIGLSPYKRQNRRDAVRWLDRCFTLLTANGRPLVKTHAFGVTSPIILHRYPWASADSSKWALAAGFGQVPVPVYTNGQPDFTVQHDAFAMTTRSTNQGRRHVDRTRRYRS